MDLMLRAKLGWRMPGWSIEQRYRMVRAAYKQRFPDLGWGGWAEGFRLAGV